MSEERSMNAKDSQGGNFEKQILKEGSYRARVYAMVDKGTQETTYQGKAKQSRVLRLSFELLDEQREFKEGDGLKPMALHWDVTNSNSEKSKLMKMAAALVSGFDIKNEKQRKAYNVLKLINVPCLVSVNQTTSKNGTIYNNVATVSQIMNNDEKNYAALTNKEIAFVIPDRKEDLALWKDDLVRLHPKTRKTIYGSPEWKQLFSESETEILEKEMEDAYAEEFGDNSFSNDNAGGVPDDEWV